MAITRIKADGREVLFGAISDLHSGSKSARYAELKDFVGHAYKAGVRVMLVSGDLSDGVGVYPGHAFELDEQSADGQVERLAKELPQLSGLHYYAISGNHEASVIKKVGLDPCSTLEDLAARTRGGDISYLGADAARIVLGPVTVEMVHPAGAPPPSISLRLQKRVSSYEPSIVPDVLLSGHDHRYCAISDKGCWAFSVPCFQGQTSYMRRLSLVPKIGGLIIRLSVSRNGKVKSCGHEMITY